MFFLCYKKVFFAIDSILFGIRSISLANVVQQNIFVVVTRYLRVCVSFPHRLVTSCTYEISKQCLAYGRATQTVFPQQIPFWP